MTADEKHLPFDASDYITGADDAVILLETALEDSVTDPSALPVALGIIARSGNMSEPARRVGMRRDAVARTGPGPGTA